MGANVDRCIIQHKNAIINNGTKIYYSVCTVLDIKRVENAFFHSVYIFLVILHAIDKQDISS